MTVQAADFVRIFTEFSNHVSFIVAGNQVHKFCIFNKVLPIHLFFADIILYISLLGAFFWLNSFGYYIWKTFRSRNVFLRVTDGRKYCYYSAYAWGLTALMAALAVFAHFFLDADSYKEQNVIGDQQTIGWLGIWIFFAPIACLILINIFFYVTTLKLINRRNVYGRIQHKLRAKWVQGWRDWCTNILINNLFALQFHHVLLDAANHVDCVALLCAFANAVWRPTLRAHTSQCCAGAAATLYMCIASETSYIPVEKVMLL